MVINYIILAHKEPEQLKRLVEKLYAENTYFYIHIDRQIDISPFELQLNNKKRVFFLPPDKRMESIWGSFGVVKATLNAITEIVKDNRHGYTILISGQCYPIKSNEYIYSFLAKNYGYNFIEGFELPHPKWPDSNIRLHYYAFCMSPKKGDLILMPPFSNLPRQNLLKKSTFLKYGKIILTCPLKSLLLFKKRRFPKGLKPYGGMQWWALPLETLKFIDVFIAENPGYLKYHLFTPYPDEIFFQTLVHNYYDNVRSPTTFACWPDPPISSPKILTSENLETLKERKELFARKFDCNVDTKILDLIDRELLGHFC